MKIFISHSHKDERTCVALAETLRAEHHDVFIYQDSISIGESILTKVNESIKKSDLFIAVITSNYLNSSWAQTELSAAVLRGKGLNLFPVVVGDLFLPNSISHIRYLKVDTLDGVIEAVVSEVRRMSHAEKAKEYFESTKSQLSEVEVLSEKISLLQSALSNNQLTLVCGAGVSKATSIPDWNDLLLGILDKEMNNDTASEVFIPPFDTKALVSQFPQSSIIVGKYLKYLLGDDFEKTLRDYLYYLFNEIESSDIQNINQAGVIPGLRDYHTSDLLQAIVNLARPKRIGKRLESIITFNFDDLVEYALRHEGVECCSIWKEGQRCGNDVLPIYHVHGFLPRTDDLDEPCLVFSEDAYHSQFIDPFCWSNLIQLNTYSENICLFVGLSLLDPNLRRILDISHRKNNECKNYIIMRKPMQRDKRVAYIYSTLFEQDANSFGLNVLWVSEFSEIPNILNKIAK